MFEIREIREGDLTKVAVLEGQIFPDAWSERAIRGTWQQENSILLGAYQEDTLVGYVTAYYILDEGEIARIGVAAQFRRQGAAGCLLEALRRRCKEREVTRLLLEVRKSNKAAIHCYRAYGFEEDGIRKNFYADPVENAILMSLEVGR